MKTARISSSSAERPVAVPWNRQQQPAPLPSTTRASMDDYAQSILEEYAVAPARPDESLGAYVVASVMEMNKKTSEEVEEERQQHEALLELLQEHCNMSAVSAEEALEQIEQSVVESKTQLSVEITGLSAAGGGGSVLSPLHEDNLIPVDLLGALDAGETTPGGTPAQAVRPLDEGEASPGFSSQKSPQSRTGESSSSPQELLDNDDEDDPFPPLGTTPPKSSKKKSKASKGIGSSSSQPGTPATRDATNVAAESTATPCSNTPGPAVPGSEEELAATAESLSYCAEVLLSMNYTTEYALSEEAAWKAARVTNGDVNFAHLVIQAANSAPPVCRHLLGAGCYRADCQYSHDIGTCIFWLRGRCGKGSDCQFLHGFDDKLMQEAREQQQHYDPMMMMMMMNQQEQQYYAEQQQQQQTLDPYVSYGNAYEYDSNAACYGLGSPGQAYVSGGGLSWEPSFASDTKNSSISYSPAAGGSSSFANIASQGYDMSSSFAASPLVSTMTPSTTTTTTPNRSSFQTAKIPQDLWTPHENRDASVFHIADPMERYRQASAYVKRQDVIDLHFQSTKTFPIVLATVLPEKLQQQQEVWIVTGTGHHVGSKTHQKGGGALENAVVEWLADQGYHFLRGRDRNGQGGAVLVLNQ